MYSRRDFGKIVLAGLPVASALAKINAKVGGVTLGVQTYSFRDQDGGVDMIIKNMTDIGLGECELFAPQVEPNQLRAMRARVAEGPGPGLKTGRPVGDPKAREELRKWRTSIPMDFFKGIRKKFDEAGITIYAYNYSYRDDFSDEEIDRGFEMAKALGARAITASTTVSVAKRVAPFADKHKLIVAMHGHSNITDPDEFAKPESFAAAMAMSKYFWVNLDIGHFFAAGYDPVAYIQEHHDRISNLHLKDRKKNNGLNTPWGEGDTPIKAVLALLKEKRYPIPAFIEYEYKGADSSTAEVKKCFEYCKAALA